jgi:hypothetical protein
LLRGGGGHGYSRCYHLVLQKGHWRETYGKMHPQGRWTHCPRGDSGRKKEGENQFGGAKPGPHWKPELLPGVAFSLGDGPCRYTLPSLSSQKRKQTSPGGVRDLSRSHKLEIWQSPQYRALSTGYHFGLRSCSSRWHPGGQAKGLQWKAVFLHPCPPHCVLPGCLGDPQPRGWGGGPPLPLFCFAQNPGKVCKVGGRKRRCHG